jgi:antitoxin VapB
MGISIKNDRAERLARQVSAETGESLTDAIIHSLEERLERLKGRRSAPDQAESLMAISRRSSALPDLDTRSAEEILGYDERDAFRCRLTTGSSLPTIKLQPNPPGKSADPGTQWQAVAIVPMPSL